MQCKLSFKEYENLQNNHQDFYLTLIEANLSNNWNK